MLTPKTQRGRIAIRPYKTKKTMYRRNALRLYKKNAKINANVMKHFDLYTQKIAQKLQSIKGISHVLYTYSLDNLVFSFWFDSYEIFNEIDKQLPKEWYVSFLQHDKIAFLKYHILEKQQQYLTDEYLMSLNAK